MNILLLFPPYPYRGRYVHRAFPLGLGYLAAVLSEHGFQTEIADLSCQTPDDGEIRSLIRSRQPDVIGISAVTENYREAMGLARLARETVPSARIVMGGVHATFRYEELLQRCPEIDFVVVGEGERTMLDLAQAISQGSPLSHIRGIDGLAFRQGDGIVRTAPRQRIDDLDALPYPAFDLLIHPRLDDYYQGETGTLPIISSRGCPFACAFCSTSAMHGKKYRVRSPQQVVDEIVV
ncbi:MAG: radical SAM protein, partial [Anaerolineae bacterium]|nr:radical SAM protein [Anaerolineae bacterium]